MHFWTSLVSIGVCTMADNRSPESRSALMSRIGGKDTAPELVVRRLLHALGYRLSASAGFTRNSRHRISIASEGHFRKRLFLACPWVPYWPSTKISTRILATEAAKESFKDARNMRALRGSGWGVLTVWQCQISSAASRNSTRFLSGTSRENSDRQVSETR